MRICLTTPYFLPIKGGISNYVYHLSKNLDEKNQKTCVITNRGTKNAENVYVADAGKIFFILKAFLQIRKFKPDVIHSHAHWYVLAPCIIYKFLHPETVVLHTFHTDPAEDMIGAKRIAMKKLLSRCDVLTFVSEYLRDKVMHNLDVNIKTKVIYGGVSLIKPEEKEISQFKIKFDLEKHYPIISFVGALSWKMKTEGVKILIKSFRQVLQKFPDSRLLIVGDGIFRKEVEDLAEELGITTEVVFTGFVDNAMIPLSVSDIYSHISLQEGFPLVVLEAMSLGKPVIASKTGGIPEVINDGENGILVDSDYSSVYNKMIDLIDSKEKKVIIGNNAKRTIENRFMWSKITENISKIYFDNFYKR